VFLVVFNHHNIYAQGQGQGGPPIWRLDGNSISEGDFLGTTNDMPLVFKINSSETMRLLPDGRVGIGLTNPQAQLDVDGDAIFRGWVYAENGVVVGKRFDGKRADIDTVKSNRIKSNTILIDGLHSKITSYSGYIDFGDTDLITEGDIHLGQNSQLYLPDNLSLQLAYLTVTKTLKVGNIKLYSEGNNLFVPGNAGNLYIQSREDCKHTIINNNNPGYVGIGTEKPGKKLHVKETRQSGYDPKPRQPKSKVNIDSTLIDQNIRERDSLITNTEKRGSIRLELTVPQEGKATTWDIQPTVSNYTNKMPGSLHFIDADKKHTVMTMQDNGAVGIGTISPMARLHVHGGNLTLTKGRMGIGVQRPQAALDVVGNVKVKNGGIEIRDGNTRSRLIPTTELGEIEEHYLNIEECAYTLGGAGIRFLTGVCPPSERMRITPGGRIGIGTDEPQRTLHVAGNILVSSNGETEHSIFFANDVDESTETGEWAIEYITAQNDNDAGLNVWKPFGSTGYSGNYKFFINNDGNVGIGTGKPGHKLDVCGKIRSSVEVVVNQEGWCDYVFEPDYDVMPWKEKENFYMENKHLPGIKPASNIMEEGLELGQTVRGVMLNVEENRLDITQLYKIIEELKQENKELRKTIENHCKTE
jgi:hypothetical protein